MKRTFLFATIASILSINAYAVSATVTSKDYVDTTRQATIPASGTNASTPGDTVVTYTDTAGTIGERGIFDDWSVGIVENSLQDNLVTAGVLLDATGEIYDDMPELPTGTAGTVPVYDNNGELGSAERGIYDGVNGYSSDDADKLVTAAALHYLPEARVTHKECVGWLNNECVLWNLSEVPVRAWQCETDNDCRGYSTMCGGIGGECSNGSCYCGE